MTPLPFELLGRRGFSRRIWPNQAFVELEYLRARRPVAILVGLILRTGSVQ